MKNFKSILEEVSAHIKEIFPWDLEDRIAENRDIILIDLTEANEYNSVHIQDSINVPRGILEAACDWGYEDTVPALAAAREKEVIVICRSGLRSMLAAKTMQDMGYKNVVSLKTGLRGWFDNEQVLFDGHKNEVSDDTAEEYFSRKPSIEQMGPS